jgi:hypothetical protein
MCNLIYYRSVMWYDLLLSIQISDQHRLSHKHSYHLQYASLQLLRQYSYHHVVNSATTNGLMKLVTPTHHNTVCEGVMYRLRGLFLCCGNVHRFWYTCHQQEYLLPMRYRLLPMKNEEEEAISLGIVCSWLSEHCTGVAAACASQYLSSLSC